MDPIHPIVPVHPPITPVLPTPLIGRIDRESRQAGAGEDRRRRRRPQPQDGRDGPGQSHEIDRGDDSGLHVDVTA